MTLEEIREEIDEIDGRLLPLFLRRMEYAEKVAEVKKEKGLPVYNEKREQEILDGVESKAGNCGREARIFFSDLMAMNRDAQHRLLGSGAPLRETVRNASAAAPKIASAACLGEEGSFSHEAALRLFPSAKPMFFSGFRAIFEAVESGAADIGVLPVENSSTGSVSEVYGLMLQYRFSILNALSLPVRHCLASSESDFGKIQVVYSHPQALLQCSGYLKKGGWKSLPCSSTAEAAERAAAPGVGAVCSLRAAHECGLNILAENIQDAGGNRTRFLAVGKTLCLPPRANKISVCFALPHRTGSLYGVLARFAAAGLNLTKIESRPIPGKNFEYDFYLDFTGNVHDAKTLDLLCALSNELSRFTFLGNYPETL